MAALKRRLGYQFHLDRVEVPDPWPVGSAMPIALTLANSGSAPLYHDYRLRLELLAGGSIVVGHLRPGRRPARAFTRRQRGTQRELHAAGCARARFVRAARRGLRGCARAPAAAAAEQPARRTRPRATGNRDARRLAHPVRRRLRVTHAKTARIPAGRRSLASVGSSVPPRSSLRLRCGRSGSARAARRAPVPARWRHRWWCHSRPGCRKDSRSLRCEPLSDRRRRS